VNVKTQTRVVIAEDEAIIRLDLKELLEEEGYEVVGETGRGDEAVDLVRDLDLIEQARDAGALAYLVKPFQRSDLIPAIEVALGRFAELVALEREVGDLAERLEARRLIDRAKGQLMDGHGMTEHQAWRFIQTQAMNRRLKVHQIAQLIIDGELTPA
jgi:two-component system, response regulator PdtaR